MVECVPPELSNVGWRFICLLRKDSCQDQKVRLYTPLQDSIDGLHYGPSHPLMNIAMQQFEKRKNT